ncbi:DUF302 domain-containing protein [Nitratidesulfovibrio liaohensis]|uniref:DUF302 domain-containing protein n=1 Tax=Nitratidesulfovibrio liaohensis TaxID=2604158 RepID=A0ABY9R407_9BACT|nr:DUF302 domain-containing protein [Nitratidesulfovibrio liaohensis]WMW65533.1 DUF302 domain-containing protein [Nitratidesulfovibrio liaohensis]
MIEARSGGVVCVTCQGTVPEVWERLLRTLDDMSVPVFCTVDHAANAERAGLRMPATRVVTFGNPAVGTLLMLEAASIAMDLPLRMLVREAEGVTVLSYARPEALAARHGIDPSFPPVEKVSTFMAGLAESVRTGR